MRRFEDWEARLDRFIRESASKPFAWGAFDCCIFIADAVLAMTGTDLALPYRKRYESARGAAILGRPHRGIRHLIAEEMELHGSPLVSAAFAQRGDIALLERGAGAKLGLVSLDSRAVLAAGQAGVVRLPRHLIAGAYRI